MIPGDPLHFPRLFVGNFDFEHVLAGRRDARQRASVQSIARDLAVVWIAVAEEGDWLWAPAEIEESFFEELLPLGFARVRAATREDHLTGQMSLCPWGWTDELRTWSQRRGWTTAAPPQHAVRAVNSRRFSFELELEEGMPLPHSADLTSIADLERHLQRLPHSEDRWVLKAEFGMSARERCVGRGRDLAPGVRRWTERHLQSDGVVFFEPWVDRVEEIGLQFEIGPDGQTCFLGATPLLSDASGGYRGSRFSEREQPARESGTTDPFAEAIQIGWRVAWRAQARGYYGPLGIDAVRYADSNGEIRLRPIQDVNARYTMGRLSLGFRRLLQPGEAGTWLHVRPRCETRALLAEWFARKREQLPSGARLIPTSPLLVGGRPPQHVTLVVVAPNFQTLRQCESVFVNSGAALAGHERSARRVPGVEHDASR